MDKNTIYELFKLSDEKKSEINSKIEEWLSLYNGEPLGNEVDGRSKIVWKIIKKQAITLQANLSKPFISASKIIELIPQTKNDYFKSKIFERLINNFFNVNFNKVKFINSATSIGIKEGTAFAYVSWKFKTKKITQEIEINSQDELVLLKEKGFELKHKDGNVFEIIKEKIVENRPYVQIIPNEDVFTDPLATSICDSRFIFVRYQTTEDELLKNKLYDKEKIKKFFNELKNQSVGSEESDDLHNRDLFYINEEPTDYKNKKFYIYEYWSREKDGIYITYFLMDGNSIEIIGKEKYDFNFLPFATFNLFENEFSIWGDSLAEIISDEQKFMTSIVRGVIDNMAMSNNGTKFVRKGALDSVNFQRLMKGHPVVEVNATGVPLSQVIMDGSFNELPSSVYNMLSIIENHAEGLTGVTKNIAGISGREINAPATNFSTMMTQAQIRLQHFSINFQHFLKKIFGMWIQMSGRYLDEKEIYDITGIDLSAERASHTKKLIDEYGINELPEDTRQKAMMLIMQEIDELFNLENVKYDFEFKVGTDGLNAIKINNINMLMQQTAPLVQGGVVPPDVLRKLLAKLTELLEFPRLAEEIEKYEPQPDPMQQQMIEVDMQEKQAKAMKEQALAQNAIARAKATEAKAKKELLSIEPEISKKYLEIVDELKDKGVE